jgi:hypothetical protein
MSTFIAYPWRAYHRGFVTSVQADSCTLSCEHFRDKGRLLQFSHDADAKQVVISAL